MRFLFLVSILLLSACGGPPQFDARVTRFHAPQLGVKGKSFVLQPSAEQAKSLEYEKYAGIVIEELAAFGMHPVTGNADFGVSFTAQTGKGQTSVVDVSPRYHAGMDYGWGGRGYGVGMGIPLYPQPVQLQRVSIYPHEFSLKLVDLKAKGQPTRFEGKATSEGHDKEFLSISRCLIHALFVGFPGEDGESVTVAIPANQCIN